MEHTQKETIEKHIEITGTLVLLIETQITQLEKIAKGNGDSALDIDDVYIFLHVIKNLHHFKEQVKFFSRQIVNDLDDCFFLMPVLRTQLEIFVTLMTLRSYPAEEQIQILLYERFIRLAKMYKKNKTKDLALTYSNEHTLHLKNINKYNMEIPSMVVDFTNKKIDSLINKRIPDVSTMIDALEDKISDLETNKIFPFKNFNIIYSHLCIYAHGDAMFISPIGREDLWILSTNIEFSLFLSEMIDKAFLKEKNKELFNEVLKSVSLHLGDLSLLWKKR